MTTQVKVYHSKPSFTFDDQPMFAAYKFLNRDMRSHIHQRMIDELDELFDHVATQYFPSGITESAKVLEDMFEATQHIGCDWRANPPTNMYIPDSAQIPAKVRSTSVGDVMSFNDELHVVNSFGFTRIK